MIIKDFECRSGHVTEHLVHPKQKKVSCSECGKPAKRIISVSGQYTGNMDAPWIRSVLDVVDKSSTEKHVREFVKNPNRRNYYEWMKGEGIRPLDHTERGGPPVHKNPPDADTSWLRNEVTRRHFERKGISVS